MIRLVYHCLLVLAAARSLAAQQWSLERRAIEAAHRIPVSKLEAGLRDQTLSRWLSRAVGVVKWEVNDCGEQTGDPAVDRRRDIPLCVGAIATLSGGRIAIVTIAMGSFHKGVSKVPTLRSVSIGREDHLDSVPKLSELPARVRAVN